MVLWQFMITLGERLKVILRNGARHKQQLFLTQNTVIKILGNNHFLVDKNDVYYFKIVKK